MSPITVCTTPSVLTKVAVLLLLVYLLMLIFRRSPIGRATLASAMMPVVLTPLFLGISASLLSLARVMQFTSLSGGGRASRAAGVAEALVMIVFAAAVGGVASAIALTQELRVRRRASIEAPQATAQIGYQIGAAALAAALLSWAGMLSWSAANDPITPREYLVPLVSSCVAAVAALCACVWLIVLKRQNTALQGRSPLGASLAGLAACVSLSFGTWQCVQYFSRIAMGK
jgi:hypothetical protein